MFAVDLPAGHVRYSLLFETIMAARWRGLSDAQFEALPPDGQARILAAYRTASRIEAIITYESIRERMAPAGRKRRS